MNRIEKTVTLHQKNRKKESDLKALGDKKVILARCGHETNLRKIKQFGKNLWGEAILQRVVMKNGDIKYCHKCLKKMAIRCALCEWVITLGDSICLYHPHDNLMPEGATIYKKKPLQIVTCARVKCGNEFREVNAILLPGDSVCKMVYKP